MTVTKAQALCMYHLRKRRMHLIQSSAYRNIHFLPEHAFKGACIVYHHCLHHLQPTGEAKKSGCAARHFTTTEILFYYYRDTILLLQRYYSTTIEILFYYYRDTILLQRYNTNNTGAAKESCCAALHAENWRRMPW